MNLSLVLENLDILSNLFLSRRGQDVLSNAPVRLLSFEELAQCPTGPAQILLPYGSTLANNELQPRLVKFGSTQLTICHQLVPPDWSLPVEGPAGQVWRMAPNGALTPTFALVDWIHSLLNLDDERIITDRDNHGRIPISSTKRKEAGISHVPHVNEALALVVDAAAVLDGTNPRLLWGIGHLVEPPTVVLSHDCDNLTGGDFWSQAARAARLLSPMRSGQRPDLSQLRYMWNNLVRPRADFYDDLVKMWDQEAELGFRSISYVLNGKGGRYGARTPFRLSKLVIRNSPVGSEIGLHYNYGFSASPLALRRQKEQVEGALGANISSGRAHYLKYDSFTDLDVLVHAGIKLDESLGWVGENAYRAGVAGPYMAESKSSTDMGRPPAARLISLPLTFTDRGFDVEDSHPTSFVQMIHHLSQIGGCATVLFHPGANDALERPEMEGVFRDCLLTLQEHDARSFVPSDLIAMVNSPDALRLWTETFN